MRSGRNPISRRRPTTRRRTARPQFGAWRAGFVGGLQRTTARVVWLGLGVAVIAFVGLFIWQAFRIRDARVRHDAETAQLAALQARNDKLQLQLDYLKGPNYGQYVERVAREALGMVKPGETQILLADPTLPSTVNAPAPTPSAAQIIGNLPDTTAPPMPQASPPQIRPAWQQWLDLFFSS